MMVRHVPIVPLLLGLRQLRCLVWSSRYLGSKLRTWSHSLDGGTKEMVNDEIQSTNRKSPAQGIYDTPTSKIAIEKQTLNAGTEKQDLKATLELLLDLGCTEDQIREDAIILNFSPQEIEKRVKVLRKVGQKKITVELLLCATERHRQNYFAKRDMFNEEILNGFSSKTEYLANRLRCTLDEIRKMYSNHVPLATASAQSLIKKLDFLMEAGYTGKEILKTPECLTASFMNLRKHFDLCGKLNLKNLPDLRIIAAHEKMFHKYMSRPMDYMEIFKEYKDFYDLVSKLLAIPPSKAEQMMKDVQRMDLAELRDKIQYLLGEGVKPYDILENSYQLRYSLDRIKNAVEQTKETLGRELSLVNVASLIVSGKRGSNRALPRNYSTFMTLLELNPKQNRPFKCVEVRLVTRRTKKLLQENHKFLQEKGFIMSDLRSCPLILGHDTETLKEGYEVFLYTLEDNLSLQKLCKDSIKRINVLQYLIEKELNFPGVVSLYDEDPQYGEEEGEEIEDDSKSELFGVDDE